MQAGMQALRQTTSANPFAIGSSQPPPPARMVAERRADIVGGLGLTPTPSMSPRHRRVDTPPPRGRRSDRRSREHSRDTLGDEMEHVR